MVGVPGKFTGCETCRVRRVKCGNERPICKKCINTGRDCQGYERAITFIVGTQDEEGRVASHNRRLVLACKANTKASQLKNNVLREKLARAATPLIRMPDAPSNELQVLALHSNILTFEPVYEPHNGPSTPPPLLNCLPSLARSSPALAYALRALCLIRLGVMKKEDNLIRQSAHINNEALVMVRMAIKNSKTVTRIETLAASICLYLYEQVACTAEKGAAWRILVKGSSSLVKQRGPSSYKTFPDHHFFVRLFRNDACFDALSRNVSTFLAEPEWLTIPWENIRKTDMDRLFDIQFLLPAIFEREGQLEKDPPSAARKLEARKLFDRCNKIAKMFDDWYDDLHAQSKEPLFWSIPRQTHKEGSAQKLGFDMCFLFPNYLQFADLNTAFLHLYYWAAISLFYHKMQHIHCLLSESTPEQSRTPSISYTARLSPDLSVHVLAFERYNVNTSPLLTPPIEQVARKDRFQSTSSEPLITMFSATPASETSSPEYHSPLNPKYSEHSVLALAYLICKSLPYTLNRTLHSLGPDHSAWPIWCALQVFKRLEYSEEHIWCTKMLEMWGREGWKFGYQIGKIEWG